MPTERLKDTCVERAHSLAAVLCLVAVQHVGSAANLKDLRVDISPCRRAVH
jgi:hypothetical protein